MTATHTTSRVTVRGETGEAAQSPRAASPDVRSPLVPFPLVRSAAGSDCGRS